MTRPGPDENRAIYIISVAAELAGVHPQTLRVYERKGLLHPQRTQGNTRRYSQKDIALLQRIQELTNDGINLAGVMKILELEQRLAQVTARLEGVAPERGDALVVWANERGIRRALRSDDLDAAARPRVFPSPPASE